MTQTAPGPWPCIMHENEFADRPLPFTKSAMRLPGMGASLATKVRGIRAV